MKNDQAEAKRKWGNTKAFKQSSQRTKKWTIADYVKITTQNKELTQQLAAAMHLGFNHPTFQRLVAKHYKSINIFYDCSFQSSN